MWPYMSAKGMVAKPGEAVARLVQAHWRAPESMELDYPSDSNDPQRMTSAALRKLTCYPPCAACMARETITVDTDVSEAKSIWLSFQGSESGKGGAFAFRDDPRPLERDEGAVKNPAPLLLLPAVNGAFTGTVMFNTDLACYRFGDSTMGHFTGLHVGADVRSKQPPTTKMAEPIDPRVKFGVLVSDCLATYTTDSGRARYTSRFGTSEPSKGDFGERFDTLLQASFALQQCRPLGNVDTDLAAANYTAVPLLKAGPDTVELLAHHGLAPSKGAKIPLNWREIVWVTSPDGYRAPVVIANFVTVTRPADPAKMRLPSGSLISFAQLHVAAADASDSSSRQAVSGSGSNAAVIDVDAFVASEGKAGTLGSPPPATPAS